MKYAIKVGNDIYPIKEEEISKVIEAMATKSIVVLKSGVFRGSFISSVVRDIHAEKGFNYFYRLTGTDEIRSQDIETDLSEKLNGINKEIKLID